MRKTPWILAVDGGGTKTRAALFKGDGEPLGERLGGPCNLYQDPTGGLAEIRSIWNALAASAGLEPGRDAAETVISAGLAGANAPGSLGRFRAAFADFAASHLSTDGYITLLGGTGGRPGALLAIGTGVVAYRLEASGALRKLSGWGFPIGDRGSGAWLGWRALGDWLEVVDGYGDRPESRLWPLLEERIGSRRTADILGWLKTARPADFAALAPIVIAEAAANDAIANDSRVGDEKARSLIDEAAGHHRRLARALAPTPREPLVLAGGLASLFRQDLAAELGTALAEPADSASPLQGARLIARGRSTAEFNED